MKFQRSVGKHTASMTFVFIALLAMALSASTTAAENDPVPIETFVTLVHFEGVPLAAARAYGVEAIPKLREMLGDPTFEPHWIKIVFTLGAIGDASAREPLVAFLTGLSGEVSGDNFRAALSVPPALGQLAHRGDDKSLQLLMAYTHPEDWRANGLGFSYQRYKEDVLGEAFGRLAVQGLGLSGREEASDMLYDMGNDPALRADWRDNVEEAMSLSDRVSQDGLASVFEGAAQ